MDSCYGFASLTSAALKRKTFPGCCCCWEPTCFQAERERERISLAVEEFQGVAPFPFFPLGLFAGANYAIDLHAVEGKNLPLGEGGGSKQSGGVDQNVGIVRIIPIAGLKSVQLMSSLGDPPPLWRALHHLFIYTIAEFGSTER